MRPRAGRRLFLGLLLAVAVLFYVIRWRQSPLAHRVVGVLDGDTLEVLRDGETMRVRLFGVDTPERGQPFAERAKQFTSELAFGQDVTLEVRDEDQYGRTVAEVILPDGRSLNLALLEAGMAWHYKQYSNNPGWAAAEKESRQARRGLWADPKPVPPWEWRRREREERKKAESDDNPAKPPGSKSKSKPPVASSATASHGSLVNTSVTGHGVPGGSRDSSATPAR